MTRTLYYDSDDYRLTRWGCSLSFRDDVGWTLKIPATPQGDEGLVREEHVFPGSATTVPPEALELATAFLRGAAVRCVAETGTDSAATVESPPEIPVPELTRRSSIRDVVRAALAEAAVAYVRCEPGLRATNDVETVHDARVAIRRFRSHLDTFAPVLHKAWASGLRSRARRLQNALAAVRDADVFSARVEKTIASLPPEDTIDAAELLKALRVQVQRAHDTLRQQMHEPWYVPLLMEIVDAAREPKLKMDRSARGVMRRIMKRVAKSLRKAVRAAGKHPADHDLHRIRIKTKNVRYAAQAFARTGGKRALRFARHAEALQEVLGEQHDAVVAVERLRRFDGPPAVRFAAGELAMLHYQGRTAGASTWRKCFRRLVRKKHRFW